MYDLQRQSEIGITGYEVPKKYFDQREVYKVQTLKDMQEADIKKREKKRSTSKKITFIDEEIKYKNKITGPGRYFEQ